MKYVLSNPHRLYANRTGLVICEDWQDITGLGRLYRTLLPNESCVCLLCNGRKGIGPFAAFRKIGGGGSWGDMVAGNLTDILLMLKGQSFESAFLFEDTGTAPDLETPKWWKFLRADYDPLMGQLVEMLPLVTHISSTHRSIEVIGVRRRVESSFRALLNSEGE
jgi:hypothetical protein